MSHAAALRVLIVEDSATDAKLVVDALRRSGRALEWQRVDNAAAMRAALDARPWDVVISDWTMPTFGALEALGILRERGLDVPLIIVSGTIGEERAADAMRLGARDYVLKDNLTRLAPAVERELREHEDRRARRFAEEQLLHAQRMEAVGRLAGGIAHDFNNLLSVMLGYSAMLCSELAPDDPVRADVEEIRLASERAAQLTRQLLAFSRQQVLQPAVVNLNAVVHGTERMLRRLIGDDVELVTVYADDLDEVLVDPGQMEQILVNLAVNARDAMPNGGRLTIATANAALDEAQAAEHPDGAPGPHVVLSVSDTGVGMTDEVKRHLFEPFFTTKEPGKGTGLGLSTVFGIVKQSGGHVRFRSTLGEGTTFEVYLPRATRAGAAARVPGPRDAAHRARGHETILLVEDEESVRTVAAMILRRGGYHVLEARSGGDALVICEHHASTIHLLLTDVVMPHMNGPELAERLRRLRPKIRVLFMSGYTDGAIVGRAPNGDAGFLQKPFTPDALFEKVRAALDAPAASARYARSAAAAPAPRPPRPPRRRPPT